MAKAPLHKIKLPKRDTILFDGRRGKNKWSMKYRSSEIIKSKGTFHCTSELIKHTPKGSIIDSIFGLDFKKIPHLNQVRLVNARRLSLDRSPTKTYAIKRDRREYPFKGRKLPPSMVMAIIEGLGMKHAGGSIFEFPIENK